MKSFSSFLFGLINAKVGLINSDCEIVVYKSEVKEISAKEEVKVDIKEKVKVGIKREVEVGIKEGVEVGIKEKVKDGKLNAKVRAKKVKVSIARIFGFYIKISCNFESFRTIEW